MLQKIFNFISKYKKIVTIFIITISLLLILINSTKNESMPKFSLAVMDLLGDLVSPIAQVKDSVTGERESETIKSLEEENMQLRQELIEAALSQSELDELRELKNALGFVEDSTIEPPVSADIITKNDGLYLKTFVISAGKNDGVRPDSILVNGRGLVGRVHQVSKNYCKAVSIIDQNSPVSFEVLGNKSDTGMLSQNSSDIRIENESLIKGYMFNINSPIKVGDTVVTSSLGLYPEGIPIGKVHQIVPDEKNLLKYIVVEPFADMQKIDKVLIFNKKNIN